MPANYRLYILDRRDRSIVEFIEIGPCSSDEVAMSKAASLVKQQPAELWNRARKVHSYEPDADQR
jgi:hypothetical protein